jgi:hypothetical protein
MMRKIPTLLITEFIRQSRLPARSYCVSHNNEERVRLICPKACSHQDPLTHCLASVIGLQARFNWATLLHENCERNVIVRINGAV